MGRTKTGTPLTPYNKWRIALGMAMKKIRVMNYWSTTQMAKYIGICQSYLTQMECGFKLVQSHMIIGLSDSPTIDAKVNYTSFATVLAAIQTVENESTEAEQEYLKRIASLVPELRPLQNIKDGDDRENSQIIYNLITAPLQS